MKIKRSLPAKSAINCGARSFDQRWLLVYVWLALSRTMAIVSSKLFDSLHASYWVESKVQSNTNRDLWQIAWWGTTVFQSECRYVQVGVYV
jgi:hypothetical protein